MTTTNDSSSVTLVVNMYTERRLGDSMSQLKQKPPVNSERLTVSCENNKNGTQVRGSSLSKLLLQTEGKARCWTLEMAGISLWFLVQNAKQVAIMPHALDTPLFTK